MDCYLLNQVRLFSLCSDVFLSLVYMVSWQSETKVTHIVSIELFDGVVKR